MSSQHVLFEEAGQFKAGTVLQDAGQSLQIELASGKRTKVKQASVMLRFASPTPSELMSRAATAADSIDIDFLWECAPQEEFDFQQLAAEYYGAQATTDQSAALLIKLHGAPVYFYRKGKGRYRPAQPETLKAALAAIERKRRQEAEIATMADELAAGRLPDAIRAKTADLLAQTDRQSIEYRAVDAACQRTGQSLERLLLAVGALAGPRDLHRLRFLRTHFPAGVEFSPAVRAFQPQDVVQGLPDARVDLFSIDDETTTEIDDGFSVQWLSPTVARVGIHIAAPALAVLDGSVVDAVARERLTTVYSPGEKFTMLPDPVVAAFSLDAGSERPAVSLYVDVEIESLRIIEQFSRVDRVRVAANLRHGELERFDDEAAFRAGDPASGLPFAREFALLLRLTDVLSAERDRVRGKPEMRARADFSFYIDGDQVDIRRRRRDSPVDRIVAELMIFANSRWGRMLADHGVAGLYRSQSFGKVKMSTVPGEHQGLGVAQYAWCTSPLRRYVDLVNQMQLIAMLEGRPPVFGANDASLFAILSAFDARYASVGEYQQTMERYWCLRWIAQQASRRLEAVAVRDDTARLADAPLYFRVSGAPPLTAGQRLLVDVLDWDMLDLTIQARAVQLLTDPDNPASVGSEVLTGTD